MLTAHSIFTQKLDFPGSRPATDHQKSPLEVRVSGRKVWGKENNAATHIQKYKAGTGPKIELQLKREICTLQLPFTSLCCHRSDVSDGESQTNQVRNSIWLPHLSEKFIFKPLGLFIVSFKSHTYIVCLSTCCFCAFISQAVLLSAASA